MRNDAPSPVHGYLPSPSLADYPGHLAAVLFTAGCNFRCGFCHNAALLAERREGIPWSSLAEQCRRWRDEWVDAAVITGGEPTLAVHLGELIAFLKGFGWKVKLDTNGSRPEVLRECVKTVDYVAMDIKAGLRQYEAVTGYDNPERIAESMAIIREQAADYEFRTTVVDSIHSDGEMAEIGRLVRGARRYIIQPFVPKNDLPDVSLRTTPRTSRDRLRALAGQLQGTADCVSVRGA